MSEVFFIFGVVGFFEPDGVGGCHLMTPLLLGYFVLGQGLVSVID